MTNEEKKALKNSGQLAYYNTLASEVENFDEPNKVNISIPLETAVSIFKLQQKLRDIEKVAFCDFLDDESTVAAIQVILKEEK